MKRFLEVLAVLFAFGIPLAAQSTYPQDQYPQDRYPQDRQYNRGYAGQWQGRMSPNDQKDFNKEYEKWQRSNAKNDRDDIDKHARKMEEIMSRYNIPPDTPFDAIASSNGYSRQTNIREFQGRFSPDDQKKFDKAYEHWMNDRRKRDRDDVARDEGKMQEIMARYNIPRDVPYDALASGGRGY
jgi:hypothetical protein